MSNFNFDFIWGRLIKFVSWIIYVLVIAFFVWKIKLIDNELINPKQNMPQYVKYVFDKVRELYRISAEQLINQLRSNAIDIFGQKDK